MNKLLKNENGILREQTHCSFGHYYLLGQFFRLKAGNLAAHQFLKWWAFLMAALHRMGAAGRENTALGRIER